MNQQKDFVRNLLVATAVFFAIALLVPKLLPTPAPNQPSPGNQNAPNPVAPGQVTQAPPIVAPGTTPSVQPGQGQEVVASEPGETPVPLTYQVVEAAEEQSLEMGADRPEVDEQDRKKTPPDSPYRMRLELSNVGASVSSAFISDYWESLKEADLYHLMDPIQNASGQDYRSLGVEGINIDNQVDLRLDDKRWHLLDGQGVTTDAEGTQRVAFYIDIAWGETPVLRVIRRYALPAQPRKDGRYDLTTSLEVQNFSTTPRLVVLTTRGGVGIREANYRVDDRFLDVGLRESGEVVGGRKTFKDLDKASGHQLGMYRIGSDTTTSPAWAATANTYFTCTIAPQPKQAGGTIDYLASIDAYDLDGSAATDADRTIRLVTRQEAVPAQGAFAYKSSVYIGPKQPQAFREIDAYASLNYYFQVSKSYSVLCTFTALVEFMVWLLNLLHAALFNYGLAIIALVLIVRGLLHPVTKKGQINMVRMQRRMQELAPKIEEVKRKYANDKARMNQELMKLNINPAGQVMSCLPMLIQMPIWVALWISLSNNILMRHEPFMLWINDLTAPDALITFSSPWRIPLFGWTLNGFNLLPLLLGAFMYTQQKLTPRPKPSPSASPEQIQQQEMMQKMMPMFSIMMLVIFYKAPSGLTLYIMSSSLFGTIEQWLIRRDIKKREAEGTLDKPEKKPPSGDGGPAKPKMPGFLERIQKMAEEAQTDATGQKQVKRPGKTKLR
jgi:YidC/Oxa1 family membrane protein insertase